MPWDDKPVMNRYYFFVIDSYDLLSKSQLVFVHLIASDESIS